jgi:hypothetical protein
VNTSRLRNVLSCCALPCAAVQQWQTVWSELETGGSAVYSSKIWNGGLRSLWQASLVNALYHFRITAAFLEVVTVAGKLFILNGELAGARTQDPRLKRAMLYQLSYELSPFPTYHKS